MLDEGKYSDKCAIIVWEKYHKYTVICVQKISETGKNLREYNKEIFVQESHYFNVVSVLRLIETGCSNRARMEA